jgi:hypothetical protein
LSQFERIRELFPLVKTNRTFYKWIGKSSLIRKRKEVAMDTVDTEIAEDILRGVKNIADYIGDDERSTNHKLATGKLPAGKEGNQWIASKSVLREHYAKLTGFSAA